MLRHKKAIISGKQGQYFQTNKFATIQSTNQTFLQVFRQYTRRGCPELVIRNRNRNRIRNPKFAKFIDLVLCKHGEHELKSLSFVLVCSCARVLLCDRCLMSTFISTYIFIPTSDVNVLSTMKPLKFDSQNRRCLLPFNMNSLNNEELGDVLG